MIHQNNIQQIMLNTIIGRFSEVVDVPSIKSKLHLQLSPRQKSEVREKLVTEQRPIKTTSDEPIFYITFKLKVVPTKSAVIENSVRVLGEIDIFANDPTL